jgi:uncharacterized protein (TIGR02118 family)
MPPSTTTTAYRSTPLWSKNFSVTRSKESKGPGVGGLAPGTPPPYVTATNLYFDNVDAFQTAFGPHVDAITGDERNFTKIPTLVQISEVVK